MSWVDDDLRLPASGVPAKGYFIVVIKLHELIAKQVYPCQLSVFVCHNQLLNVSETQRFVVPHQDIHALCLELVSGKGMLARELLGKVLSRFADALQG